MKIVILFEKKNNNFSIKKKAQKKNNKNMSICKMLFHAIDLTNKLVSFYV